MGKRGRKKKGSLVDTDTVIDLDAQREARRRQLREAAAESRRRRGAEDTGQSGYDYYGDNTQTQRSVFDEETSGGKVSGGQRAGQNQKKKRLTPVRIAILTAALVALICLVCSVWNIVSLKMEEKESRNRIEELKEEKAALKKEAGSIGTEEYIEEQARQWLKMAKSGEIIYIFDSGEEDER